jgi:hypothetical protein
VRDMTHPATPFAITRPLTSRLQSVLDEWRSLLRGGAEIPFADDVVAPKLEAVCPDIFVLGVFEKPRRFRLDLARTPDAPNVDHALLGRFIDEVDLPAPMEFLRAQTEATVESMQPTFYEHAPHGAAPGYGRLLLPAWGEGKVSLVIGAVEFR